MKHLFIGIFALALSVTTLSAQDAGISSIGRPVDVDVDFQPSYFESKPWVKEFHYVVVINKATKGSEAQTINVYEYGRLIIKSIVSTGRDGFEKKGEHHSVRDSWSVTPTGYYTPSYLDKDHRSGAYGKWRWLTGGTLMPYAMFFNEGIAMHQFPKGTESQLGTNASGGCVRLKKEVAIELFTRIGETKGQRIPKFNVDGTITTDENGNYSYRNSGFSTLIIVKNKIVE
jgi:hypothetical protein